jgi:hypothetical protein
LYYFQTVLEFEDFTIDCRPTHPDVIVAMIEVSLNKLERSGF